ncbi:alpha/beta-hydrolase [Xylariaceae sp. FL0255]|nr:alpha/beta-hydrolase [Xylariaceae sp. FL0255]
MATAHALIGKAAKLPMRPSLPIFSFLPVVVPSPGRPVDLELRVTMPASGTALPIVLLSHGQGRSNWLSSHHGYAPLAEFWAKQGFAVIQPTHLSSSTLGLLGSSPPGNEMYWQSRPQDMIRILDHLDLIEETVPGLKGRLDRDRVAVAGHSFGAQSASMLLGAKNTDPRDESEFRPYDPRIKAGVIITGSGNGGSDMSENGKKMVPFYNLDFSSMTTPALVVGGDIDVSPHLTVRGADWHWDGYTYGAGSKDLLLVKGGHHGLGGISGWDAAETQDEGPERLGLVQRMTTAYMRSRLYEGDNSWELACKALGEVTELGSVESKQ